tara:strand:+ start:906 stop:1250 length:345 start_codon:yes stop_codon:yes gene_type:complete
MKIIFDEGVNEKMATTKKLEEKRQFYYMKELLKETKSKFKIDIDYKKLEKIAIPNTKCITVEANNCKVEMYGENITYKNVIEFMVESGNFKEFNGKYLEDLEVSNNKLIALFSS